MIKTHYTEYFSKNLNLSGNNNRIHGVIFWLKTIVALLFIESFHSGRIIYKGNYDIIVNLIGGLIGGADSGMSDTISKVLELVKGDSDTVIKNLVDLLQSFA